VTGKLVYTMNVSLDGFVATPSGDLEWASIDDEIHAWFNELEASAAASFYGRRLYDVMAAYWPGGEEDPDGTEVTREFSRIWKAMPKIVFSRTLDHVDHNSRLVSGDVGAVLADTRKEFDGDLHVGGPTLAGQFIQRGLVDEFRTVVHPVVLGAGLPFWPALNARLRLRMTESRTFSSGVEVRTYVPA
jgi:dihydrofolate reductase